MKKNILLIDDEKIFRNEVKHMLQNTSFNLETANDSIDGLKKITENKFDLVLLDIDMPDLNYVQSKRAGIELLEHIGDVKPQIPIIMMTALDKVQIAVETMKKGVIDYLVKSELTRQKLIDTINQSLFSSILELISKGESENLEFKSSLRWDMVNNKRNDNLKFSVLKTIVAFMNTNGGTLLVGVEDNGNIIGIGHDNFPNEDKYMLYVNNSIKNHIGTTSSKYLKIKIINENSKNVLFVECRKSNNPVFLKHNNEEDFYIRLGNSSRKLSMSEMLDYVKDRK